MGALKSLIKSKVSLKLLFTLFSILFIGFSITNNFEKLLDQSLDKFTFLYLLLGYFVSWLSLFVNAIAWQSIVKWLGYRDLNINLISLFLSSNILKYLPGGVWHFAERIRILKKQMKTDKAFISVLIEPIFMIIGALIWVALGDFNILIRLACLIPLLIFLDPFKYLFAIQLNKIQNSLIRKIGHNKDSKEYIIRAESLSSNYPLYSLLLEVLFISLRFFSFWLCLHAFSLGTSIPILQWSAFFSIGWIIGLVVPSAPGGVGIFEAALLLMIGDNISESALISSLLCYRLIASVADLTAGIFSTSNNN